MACVSTCLPISSRLSTPHSNFSRQKKSLVHFTPPLDHFSFPRIVTKRVSRTHYGLSMVRATNSDNVPIKPKEFVESDKLPKKTKGVVYYLIRVIVCAVIIAIVLYFIAGLMLCYVAASVLEQLWKG